MKKNIKIIWLTAVHILLVGSVIFNYLYISDQYALVKIDALQQHEQQEDAAYQINQEQYARQIAEAGSEAKATVWKAVDRRRK